MKNPMFVALQYLNASGGAQLQKRAAAKIGSEGVEALRDLLAMLRAMHWNYWTSHWQSKGDPFYGDHLMFERIYGSIIDEIDGLAEKMVALIGPEAVDPVDSIGRAHTFLAGWSKTGDPVRRALASEAARFSRPTRFTSWSPRLVRRSAGYAAGTQRSDSSTAANVITP